MLILCGVRRDLALESGILYAIEVLDHLIHNIMIHLAMYTLIMRHAHSARFKKKHLICIIRIWSYDQLQPAVFVIGCTVSSNAAIYRTLRPC